MSYAIEPIFILFPLICLFFHITDIKARKELAIALSVAFILIYSFSLNGSDFDGYRQHYEMVERGATATQNDQEIGFYYLMKLSVSLGLSYVTFRIALLSLLSIVLFYALHKMTDDFPLALFFLSSMFVIYTISAYRQFIVIGFSILWMYLYSIGKKRFAILATMTLLFFHVTAVLPLGCMLLIYFGTNEKVRKATGTFSNSISAFIVVALIIRFVMSVLLRAGLVNSIVTRILSIHASSTPTFFSFGLLSRIVFLVLIAYLYRRTNTENSLIKLLFFYYSFSILLYITIPLEFFMGRLMNNAHILAAVLIPMLRTEIVTDRSNRTIISPQQLNGAMMALESLALVILVNQLLNQDGYTPYMNVLLGDTSADIPYHNFGLVE